MRATSRTRFALCILMAATAAPAWAQAQDLVPGAEFPDFSAKDAISGKPFSLKDLRGKVVLVDFWATWCRPCLAELPNVRTAYKKYGKDGLEVVSISLDQTTSAGLRYIQNNDMPWRHVVEGGGWSTRLSGKYGIRSIPAMFLLDREGKIASVRPRGQRLQQELARLFGDVPPGDQAKDGDANADSDAKRSGSTKSRTPQLDEARKLLSDGQYLEAAEILERIIERDADSQVADTARKLLEKMQSDEKIAAELKAQKEQREREQRARIAEGLLSMAKSLAATERYDAARRYYERVVHENPDTEYARRAQAALDKLPE